MKPLAGGNWYLNIAALKSLKMESKTEYQVVLHGTRNIFNSKKWKDSETLDYFQLS